MSAFKAFKKAGQYLDMGMSLAIFPEGKIPDGYPPVLDDFKNGPFRLAVEHKIPIIPVTISDSWKKMWDNGSRYGSRPGICDICVHTPIETSALSPDNMDSLRDRVYEIINSEFEKNEAR
jgi:1-acyl-sn-glycerol-3-phosphate acyltransferase